MAPTPRALAAPSSRGWRLSTASRTFRVLHRLDVILSLRRIRDPSARGDEVRILRLRSQARFAQDDTALRDRVRTFRNPLRSYGQRSGLATPASRGCGLATGQKAVRRRGPGRVVLGSKPQLATTEKLVSWAGDSTHARSLRLPKNSCAGLHAAIAKNLALKVGSSRFFV